MEIEVESLAETDNPNDFLTRRTSENAFVAGLANTIIQLVYLTQPAVAESGGPRNFFQGSSLLFSNWPAIEIGVGLIAWNLPSLSFRAAHAIPKHIRHGRNLSLTGIRHAAERLSLRWDPKNSYTDAHPKGTGDNGTASQWYHSRHESLAHPIERGPAATISEIPLVQLRSKVKADGEPSLTAYRADGYISEPTAKGNGRVIKGFEAV